MGWLIVLAVLILLAILPLGIDVRYDSSGILVRLIAGPVRVALFPQRGKKGKAKEKNEENRKQTPDKKPMHAEEHETQKGGSISDFIPLVHVALDFLGDFRRKLRINRLEMKLIMAGDDPCDLALNYGRAWVALGNLMPQLERLFVIKRRDLQVECDFTAENTVIYARSEITITLGRLVALGTRYGIRALRQFLKIQKKRKGGALQ